MYGHISAWESSGESQQAYMAAHGLSKSVFGYWLRKYRQEQRYKSGCFVAVTASAETAVSMPDGFVRLRIADGTELIIQEAVSAAYLRELLGW